jgi:DNA-binding MarR family transcriptional regulator
MVKEASKERAALKVVGTPPVDAETRVHDDHHVSLRIRQNLQARFDTTLPRFDLMAQLERAPEGLKMSELSQRMMVTGGNVTGITDGLEKEGLVVREVDATDRRVFRVKLTAEGQRQFQRMATEHEQWVVDLFGGLSQKQKKQLVDLLGELKAHISGAPSSGERP